MAIQVQCDHDACEKDIKEETGFQLIEGEVLVNASSEIVEQEEYHGVFCSKSCLRNYLTDGENQ